MKLIKLCFGAILCATGCAYPIEVQQIIVVDSGSASPATTATAPPDPTPDARTASPEAGTDAVADVIQSVPSIDADAPTETLDAGVTNAPDGAMPTCVIDGQKYSCDTSSFRVTSPIRCELNGQSYPADAAEQVGEQCSDTDYPCIAMVPGCPMGWVCWVLNGSGSAAFGACQ